MEFKNRSLKILFILVLSLLYSCSKEEEKNALFFYQEGIYKSEENWHFHKSGYEELNLELHKSKAEIYRYGKTFISGKEYVDTIYKDLTNSRKDTLLKYSYHILF
jgi:hypothetical protein